MSAVVIGAGLAGTVAAARLASLGVEVIVIADRPGATIHHGGGWLLGLETLTRFGVPAPRMHEALEFVEAGLTGLHLEDGPFTLLDTDGVPREVDVAPRSHAAAARLPAGSGVAHLAGLGHPFAEMCAGFEPVSVAWPDWPGAFGRSYAAAASRIEADAAQQDALIEALKAALAGKGLPGLLLPPVLGLSDPDVLCARIEAALGVPVAEALGTLPSTPGLRLHRGLGAWLARIGVTVRRGRITAVDLEAGVVRLGEEAIPAAAVILATGGPLGGGLTTDQTVREPLLDLRVAPELPVDWSLAVRPDLPGDAPLFRAGVPVNSAFRPTGWAGVPVHPRLFAVGDLLAGADVVVDRCGSGLALLSAFVAAEQAAKALGEGG